MTMSHVYFMRCNLASTFPRCAIWDLERPFHQETGKCMPAWTPTVELCQNKKEKCFRHSRHSSVTTVQNTFLHVCTRINRSDVWCVWRYWVYAFMHAHFVCMLMSVSFHSIFQPPDFFTVFDALFDTRKWRLSENMWTEKEKEDFLQH